MCPCHLPCLKAETFGDILGGVGCCSHSPAVPCLCRHPSPPLFHLALGMEVTLLAHSGEEPAVVCVISAISALSSRSPEQMVRFAVPGAVLREQKGMESPSSVFLLISLARCCRRRGTRGPPAPCWRGGQQAAPPCADALRQLRLVGGVGG